MVLRLGVISHVALEVSTKLMRFLRADHRLWFPIYLALSIKFLYQPCGKALELSHHTVKSDWQLGRQWHEGLEPSITAAFRQLNFS